jgi:hypothetical protein
LVITQFNENQTIDNQEPLLSQISRTHHIGVIKITALVENIWYFVPLPKIGYMDILIDFDGINDSSKKEWLLRTLKLMGIGFQTIDRPQTLEEYNQELEEGEAEILKGNYITNEQLRKEIAKW